MKSGDQKTAVPFSKAQYATLLKLAYVGNWIANAHQDGCNDHPHRTEYDELQDYLFAKAPDFGLGEVARCEGGVCGPTWSFEQGAGVQELIDEYDEETFWQELCDRLGERDFLDRYSRTDIEKMEPEEYFEKLDTCRAVYEDEAEEYGLERMMLMGVVKKPKM